MWSVYVYHVCMCCGTTDLDPSFDGTRVLYLGRYMCINCLYDVGEHIWCSVRPSKRPSKIPSG